MRPSTRNTIHPQLLRHPPQPRQPLRTRPRPQSRQPQRSPRLQRPRPNAKPQLRRIPARDAPRRLLPLLPLLPTLKARSWLSQRPEASSSRPHSSDSRRWSEPASWSSARNGRRQERAAPRFHSHIQTPTPSDPAPTSSPRRVVSLHRSQPAAADSLLKLFTVSENAIHEAARVSRETSLFATPPENWNRQAGSVWRSASLTAPEP